MRRSMILATALAAFSLVPVAQAAANQALKVNIVGDGKGEVHSSSTSYIGTPPIECTYSPKAGICENVMSDEGEGYEAVLVQALPAPGSVFVKWIVKGVEFEGCGALSFCAPYVEPSGTGAFAEVTAVFAHGDPLLGDLLGDLTLTKSPSVFGGKGTGSVSSKPQGIKCGATCSKAVASLYKGANVALAAKPSMGSTFVEWTGACSGSVPTCTVKVDEAKEVGAVFGGTSKAFSPAEALTVSKGESTGQGAVKVYGSLACEAACTETTNYYQGPIVEKGNPGRTVVLEQRPAFGSEFSGWSGCDEVTETGYCIVTMESNRKVTAEYTALPNVDLTVKKSAYASGAGKVISKPKGINCAATCTTQSAAMPEGASVTLTAKPGKETELVEWQGGDCDEVKSLVCTATMDEAEEITAVFKGPTKTINPAETLTLAKAGSGFGTVKGAGLKCEFLCTSTGVIYQGPIVEPKAKPGKTVILKGAPAPGSKPVEWSGCDSIDEEGNCVAAMESSRKVTARFNELE